MTTLQEETTIRKLASNEKMPYDLLLLADPSVTMINSYLPFSDVYVLEQKKQVIAAYVLLKDNDAMEIRNIAVNPAHQGKGLGKMLLQDAAQRARADGFKKICIGTGNSSIAQLYLYQRQGFEISAIRKNYFTTHYSEPIYENGIQCRHMIVLEKWLG
ncbi:GNAT family N-acetyltransferase [Chitinophaga sp. OAE865]|uniref:GNAT family N-acetyltransferase n=1 Tax=Chitinophaga sp. OAE865 TaxID=2817898 RepID=UPI001AE2719B